MMFDFGTHIMWLFTLKFQLDTLFEHNYVYKE